MSHLQRNSEDFRAGIAYAAHMLLHSVGAAHGGSGEQHPTRIESRPCCRGAVAAFAFGVADGLGETAGCEVEPHDHSGGAR